MEDLLMNANIDWIRKRYGENIEKVDILNFHNSEDGSVADIRCHRIGNNIDLYEYIIDCEELSNLILLPVDTKIYVSYDMGPKWSYYGDVITFALEKPERTHAIQAVNLMGGGYVVMNRYIINKGDKIKFVTKRQINPLHVAFNNVIRFTS